MRIGPSLMYRLFHLIESLLRPGGRRQGEQDAGGEEGRQHRRKSPGSPLMVWGTMIQGGCRAENDRSQEEGECDQRVREGLAVQQPERNDANAHQDDGDPHGQSPSKGVNSRYWITI